MKTIVKKLITRWRSRAGRTDAAPHDAAMQASSPNHEMDPIRAYAAARALSQALDRALERSQWAHADRLAESATRLASHHPMLRERIARLRLQQGQADEALSVIEGGSVWSASLRLLKAICLVQLGRRIEAQLELQQWASKPSAPLQARLLLALMEWQDGDADAAAAILQRNLRQLEDPKSLAALMMMSAAQGNQSQTEYWAQRVRAAIPASDEGKYNAMLASIGQHRAPEAVAEHDINHVQSLAVQLLQREDAIPALVEAQRLHLHPPTARLLAGAIQAALSELQERADAYIALASLSEMLGDSAQAMQWAQQGLRECPMSMSLASLQQELSANAAATAPEQPMLQERAA